MITNEPKLKKNDQDNFIFFKKRRKTIRFKFQLIKYGITKLGKKETKKLLRLTSINIYKHVT